MKVNGLISASSSAAGSVIVTSFVSREYDHNVFPSYHVEAMSVSMTNRSPARVKVPDETPLPAFMVRFDEMLGAFLIVSTVLSTTEVADVTAEHTIGMISVIKAKSFLMSMKHLISYKCLRMLSCTEVIKQMVKGNYVKQHLTGLAAHGRTNDTGGLHLVHDFPGAVIAYAITALQR